MRGGNQKKNKKEIKKKNGADKSSTLTVCYLSLNIGDAKNKKIKQKGREEGKRKGDNYTHVKGTLQQAGMGVFKIGTENRVTSKGSLGIIKLSIEPGKTLLV